MPMEGIAYVLQNPDYQFVNLKPLPVVAPLQNYALSYLIGEQLIFSFFRAHLLQGNNNANRS